MCRKLLLILIPLLVMFAVLPVSAQLLPEPILSTESLPGDPQILVDWMNVIYDRVEAEALSAPAGSRVYGYAGVTAYEAAVPFMSGNRSLSTQLNGLGDLPLPEFWFDLDIVDLNARYDVYSVINTAMYTVAAELFRDKSQDSRLAFAALRDTWAAQRAEDGISEEVLASSAEYGELLGKSINDWINEDNYREIRQRDPYVMPTGEGTYELTAEAVQPAEPYWGDLRTFIMPYNSLCWQTPNWEYSEDPESPFYMQAYEVFETGNDLTPEQRNIAEWWVDTPSITGTPSGHWVQIENQLTEQLELDLGRAAEMYAMVGMVLADTFIVTWDQKYEINLIRPESYINQHISQRWRPYIQTPPFPEYPSGHSVTSGGAADMLTALFGTVHFIDETHIDTGEAPREFFSFEQAANEAAISRMYGGIHYRSAIENGLRSGQCIANTALNSVVMRPLQQGE